MERERTGRAGKRGKVKGKEVQRAGEERERNGKSMSLFNSPLLEALPDVTSPSLHSPVSLLKSFQDISSLLSFLVTAESERKEKVLHFSIIELCWTLGVRVGDLVLCN